MGCCDALASQTSYFLSHESCLMEFQEVLIEVLETYLLRLKFNVKLKTVHLWSDPYLAMTV